MTVENPGNITILSDEVFATSHHLRWGPLPPNNVAKITHYARDGEGRKEGKKERNAFKKILETVHNVSLQPLNNHVVDFNQCAFPKA